MDTEATPSNYLVCSDLDAFKEANESEEETADASKFKRAAQSQIQRMATQSKPITYFRMPTPPDGKRNDSLLPDISSKRSMQVQQA